MNILHIRALDPELGEQTIKVPRDCRVLDVILHGKDHLPSLVVAGHAGATVVDRTVYITRAYTELPVGMIETSMYVGASVIRIANRPVDVFVFLKSL
jgi:hypothetical protein